MSQKASADGGEDTLDADLELIGEVEREGNGVLAFSTFKKIFQISVFYGKKQFAVQKKEMTAQRREAFRNKDEKRYEEIVM